jgi:hypothetical protein
MIIHHNLFINQQIPPNLNIPFSCFFCIKLCKGLVALILQYLEIYFIQFQEIFLKDYSNKLENLISNICSTSHILKNTLINHLTNRYPVKVIEYFENLPKQFLNKFFNLLTN